MCVFVKLWHWTFGPGWRQPSAVWVLSGRAVLMAARGYWKSKNMCVWARNSCSFNIMTTCVLSVWFMDVHDVGVSSKEQDRQDAVNILHIPDDIFFSFFPWRSALKIHVLCYDTTTAAHTTGKRLILITSNDHGSLIKFFNYLIINHAVYLSKYLWQWQSYRNIELMTVSRYMYGLQNHRGKDNVSIHQNISQDSLYAVFYLMKSDYSSTIEFFLWKQT